MNIGKILDTILPAVKFNRYCPYHRFFKWNTGFGNNIIFGQQEEWVIKKGGIGKAYFDSMKKFSTRTAQIEGNTGKTDLYESLLKKSTRLAIYLNGLGISRGDIISLWSDCNLDASVPLIAAQFIGAITFSVEPDQTPRDAGDLMFKQLPPKLVFTTKKLLSKTQEALKISECLAKIIIFEENEFKDIIYNKDKNEDDFSPVYVQDLNETAVYHFTSGSTGIPKIVRQSHYFLFAADGDSAKTLGCYENKASVVYTMANWFWGAATRILAMSIMHGACRILGDAYEADTIFGYTERYKISHMLIVPQILNNFKNNAESVKKFDYSSLKAITSVGQPIHPTCMQMVRMLLPNVTIFNYYGQSEMGAITMFCLDDPKDNKLMLEKPTSVGHPLEGINYKVVNPETEEILGINQRGEIRIKSKRYCEYLNRDPSESIDSDGWYKTGDVGYYDDDFCFFVVDRIKDEFKYHLWHISPGYLQDVILNHPAVANVVVVGKPHETEGALPTALIVLKESFSGITEEEIVKFVDEQVDDRMRLRGGVRFLESFPLTATKKVDKIALRKMVENEQ